MKRRRALSKTPRSHGHSRKVEFSIAMRKKLSESWVALRKEVAPKKVPKKKLKQMENKPAAKKPRVKFSREKVKRKRKKN